MGRPRSANAPRARCSPRRQRDRADRGRARLDRAQRPLQHEQLDRTRVWTPPAPTPSAPTGSAPTCSRSPEQRTSGCEKTISLSAELAARAPRRRGGLRARFGEARFGRLEAGAPADLVVLDYAAPAPLRESSFAGHWIFGLSSRHVRDVMVGGEWVVRDRKLTRVDQEELAAEARLEAERLWKRLDEVGAHTFHPKGGRPWPSPLSPAARTAWASTPGQAPDSRRHALCAARRGGRFRGGLAGGEPPRAGGNRADGRVRCRHGPDRDRLGRRELPDAKRRLARRDLLDARRSRARPDQARNRRLWDPLTSKVGIRRRRPVQTMREMVEVTRRLKLNMERVTYHGEFVDVDDIEIDIVHGDRSPKDVRSTSPRRRA